MTINRSGRDSSEGTQGSFPDHDNRDGDSNAHGDEISVLSHSMLNRLSRTIESEIVPRLMMALDASRTARLEPDAADALPELDVDEFVRLLITHDAPVASEYVKTLRTAGVPLASIYLDLLGPSARRLGEMWEHDECSFTDVTIGVCRMHQVLLEYGRCFEPLDAARAQDKCALIVPAPGEQHTFGLFLVVEFLRRDGWHCWTGSPRSMRELHGLARKQHFDAIGLSVGAERNLARLADIIRSIREHSTNPDVKVLLGGHVFSGRPELARQYGADATGSDGRDAVKVLNRLCSETRNNFAG
jgi:methanogenic corrinoid protein MtbC1